MPLRAQCDECGQTLGAPDQFAGKRVKCPWCGAAVRMPAAPQAASATFTAAQRPPGRGPLAVPHDRIESLTRLDTQPFAPTFPPASAQPARRSKGVDPALLKKWMIIGAGGIGFLLLITLLVRSILSPPEGAKAARVAATSDKPADASADSPASAAPSKTSSKPDNTAPAKPEFPPGSPPVWRRQGNIELADVHLTGPVGRPASNMKLYLYRPAGQTTGRSLPCLLIAGAGAALVTGMELGDGDRTEHYPYANAGYAVVAYDIDGGVRDLQRATIADLRRAFEQFSAAEAGLANARRAIDYTLSQFPQVDPEQIFAAGHSSAGTMALVLAEHEPRLKGCIAYAPCSDLIKRAAPGKREFDQVGKTQEFFHRYSPIEHAADFKCPLFLFHASDDSNVPVSESQALNTRLISFGKQVELKVVPTGDHYQSMISAGIPSAIRWLAKHAKPVVPSTGPPNLAGPGAASPAPRASSRTPRARTQPSGQVPAALLDGGGS